MSTQPRTHAALATLLLAAISFVPLAGAQAPSAEEAGETILFVACPGGWEHQGGNKFVCDQAYGSYGTGIVRPCRDQGVYGAAAPVLHAQGLCDRRSPANVTLALLSVADHVVARLAEDPATSAATAAFTILCPGGWEGHGSNKALCDQTYGNYGTGIVRPCGDGNVYGTAAPALQDAGLCGPRSAANLTFEAAGVVDGLVGLVHAPAPEGQAPRSLARELLP